MYGRVDRGGSREGKKSLRKNKQVLNKVKQLGPDFFKHNEETLKKIPPSILRAPTKGLIDCCCGLVNRRFENDGDKVINRAVSSKVETMIIMSNDFDKQEALLKLSKQWNSVVYVMPGIHPDNVKRTNDKVMVNRLAELKTMLLSENSVAIFCGLDYTREVSTHFPQEKLLKDQVQLAAELEIPIVLYHSGVTGEQLFEKVVEMNEYLDQLAIFNFNGTEEELSLFLTFEMEVYFIFTGNICNPKLEKLLQLLPKVPLDRILVASDSPFNTPQNISDVWIRESRNEPANLPFIVEKMAEVLSMNLQELTARIRLNTKNFFNLYDEGEAEESTENSNGAPNSTETPPIENLSLKEEVKQENSQKMEVPPTPAPKVETPVVPEVSQATASDFKPLDEIKYACKKCRNTLFTSKNVKQHGEDLEESFPSKVRRSGRSRDDSVEIGACQMWFLKDDSDWTMIVKSSHNDDDAEVNLEKLSEGKLSCPGCSAKVGRWTKIEALECSCGHLNGAPSFMVRKKFIDVVLPVSDLSKLTDEELGHESDEEEPENKKKGGSKKKKGPKKNNKQNLSSFRNKG